MTLRLLIVFLLGICSVGVSVVALAFGLAVPTETFDEIMLKGSLFVAALLFAVFSGIVFHRAYRLVAERVFEQAAFLFSYFIGWKSHIALDEKYSLALCIGRPEPGLWLCEDGKKALNFAFLIEDEIKLRRSIRWDATFDADFTPVVFVPRFQTFFDLLSLLHEVGHVTHPKMIDAVTSAKLGQATLYKDVLWYRENVAQCCRALHREHEIVMRSEREAWAFALRALRVLEKHLKEDLTARCGGAHIIKHFIDTQLLSYRDYYARECINPREAFGCTLHKKGGVC